MATRLVLLLTLTSLLLLSTRASLSIDDDEDLSFLDEPTEPSHASPHYAAAEDDDEDFSDLEEGDDEVAHKEAAEVDEKDVVILKGANFSETIKSKRFVMVEFYAPWCGHCQALAPEYAAAATELQKSGGYDDVALAKIDATEENELSQAYEIQGFPTIVFFSDGVHKPYTGQNTKESIVTWIKKKTGPGVANVTTVEEAERILASETKFVAGFLDSLVGPESDELSAASRLEDEVNFYQTVDPKVAKVFHVDSDAKRPAVVLIKKEDEKLSHFDGKFDKSAIAEFVFANKLPLVVTFTRENAPSIFESEIKRQLLLFATSKDSKKVLPEFVEAAKLFKGKLIFVFVELDNEDVGKPVSEYFGITGDGPTVLAYTGNDDARKFILDKESTLANIKAFGEDFLEDKLKAFYKSDPIPESNDGDVKIVVGNNFDDIVLDESKDVLLEIYAPWCGHCKSLEPIYNKLAKHLSGIKSIVITKMDGTTNEHPRAKADGFPTILFFPAGNKSFDPITVDSDRTVVAFYKFIKKHASIPFKLQKPTSTPKSEESDAKESQESSTTDVKDEL